MHFLFLREAWSKATDTVYLKDVEMDTFQFCSIIIATRGVKTLIMQNCKIITDSEWDFGVMHGCSFLYPPQPPL